MPRDGMPARPAKREILMPWQGRNAALLKHQVRCSTGMVERFRPPVAAVRGDAVEIDPRIVSRLFTELERMALERAVLPGLDEIGRLVGLASGARARDALEHLVGAGRIALMEGLGMQWVGAMAISLPSGAVLRSVDCPVWWTP